MLLQSQSGEIVLLPALPKAWPTGTVKGIRARGGFELDFAWEQGKVTRAVVRSVQGGTARIVVNGKQRTLVMKANSKQEINP